MCIVIDLDVVCLVCLRHSQKMHGIFAPDEDSPDLQIAHKITTLSKLNVSADNESLPDKICEVCLEDLRAAWRFHKNCQTAAIVFQSIFRPKQQQDQPAEASSSQTEDAHHSPQVAETEENSQAFQQQSDSIQENDITEADSIMDDATRETNFDESQDAADIQETFVTEETETTKIPTSDFLVEDDFLSVGPDTIEEETDLVEYYLTDDGLHEQFEETSKKPSTSKLVEKTQLSTRNSLLKSKNQGNTVSSVNKKLQPSQDIALTQEDDEAPSRGKKQPRLKMKSDHVRKQFQTSDNDEEFSLVQKSKPSQKRKHGSEPKAPKICELCGNSYRYQHALSAHMRRHFQDKPFPCELCDKAFVSNVELRRHMRVHTGHKPYGCQYCDRRFSDFGSRIKHERTHTGERPYQCGTCGKSFAYPHVLSVHLRTHTGEKRFQCGYCPKGFTKKAYLVSHTTQHHTEQESTAPHSISELSIDGSMSDDGGDNSDYQTVKSEKFEDCLYTEFVHDESDAVSQADNDQDVEDVCGEDSGATIISQDNLLHAKEELEEDEEIMDEESEVVEVRIDDYTIRMR